MAKKSRKNLLKKKQVEDESLFRDTIRTLDVIPYVPGNSRSSGWSDSVTVFYSRVTFG